MKGIILAGGMGTRLLPLTKSDNKHLLPVYNRRMIEYPLMTLVDAGIDEIILVTGGQRPGTFLELFQNGSGHGVSKLYYTYQDGNAGIADALKLAEPFLQPGEPCVVILGDNYFDDGISTQIQDWNDRGNSGSHILLKEVDSPWDFGIASVKDGRVISMEEKPKSPKSNHAIIGCYMFDYDVWSYINSISPSDRGEFEITDVLSCYLENDAITYSAYDGFWNDMGTFESWSEVSARVFEKDQIGNR